jgi:hypothetical protein
LPTNSSISFGGIPANIPRTGDRDTVLGTNAGGGGSLSADNVLIGFAAGTGATGAIQCVIIGSNAGTNITNSATGTVAIGYLAGASLTTGNNNIFIGPSAGNVRPQTTSSNNIIIGSRADDNTSGTSGNAIVIGATGPTDYINIGQRITRYRQIPLTDNVATTILTFTLNPSQTASFVINVGVSCVTATNTQSVSDIVTVAAASTNAGAITRVVTKNAGTASALTGGTLTTAYASPVPVGTTVLVRLTANTSLAGVVMNCNIVVHNTSMTNIPT